ncbi:NUDIX domain-containing protein [Micromonospora auratinigra]|uniref:8-oxo-dGTP diphosphatase n=1 Tax=Micromonospora auratinigra TaxID=261654 RepID=A0A1A8ZMG9_9ACTN|nr:NUDIX domain-containing protein [Micromonospora auratinigra]SBT45083.1 8-oxo-dGTP diphosphatase [Micromonospora auratinigra]
MTPGRDFVGVGVGAIVLDDRGSLLLARRGPAARNEVGTWEFPGGMVDFGERLADAVRREFREEYGIEVAVTGLLGVFDHLLPAEHQHWISVTYLARHVSGVPRPLEPAKCTAVDWFPPTALPAPLSAITQQNLATYLAGRPAPGREG